MEYSVRGRVSKVNKLFFRILFRFLGFKVFSVFLSKTAKKNYKKSLHEKSAIQIADVLMELEGLFLKFAQQVSTMSSLLPQPYIKAFERAQDHSNPRPFTQIKKRVELELNDKIENIFISFNETPIGTASIGQVHQAVLKSGESVAVKVQHLNIDEIAKLDLELIKKLLKIVQFFIKIPGFDSVFEEVSIMINQELDYIHEAEQITIISKSLKKDTRIIIPNTYPTYSTKKVLVMDFVQGKKITDRIFTEKHDVNRELLASNLLDIFSKNIFVDGVYHADPHPGNILVNEHGQIILLDFGAVGTFGKDMKEGLIILIQAAVLKDENLMIGGLKKMGFISNSPGIDRVCKKIIRLLGDFLVDEIKIDKLNFSEININQIDLTKAFALIKEIDIKEIEEVVKIPKEWVLLNRTIALIIGISSEISPTIDIFEKVKPNLYRMAIQKESLGMILKTTLQQQALRVISLPRKFELFLEQAENGELEINVKSRKLEVKLMYALVQQVVFLIGGFACYYFHQNSVNELMYYGGFGAALLFVKSFLTGLYYKRKLR
jgi:predicted unusual protein kinase regulating ubiquinone biosynthesis (AarF/ABC1/UbiB family)